MDFSQLTDEQLLQLLEGVLRETVRRGGALESAAREVMLSEKEKAEITAAAARRAKEQVAREEAARLAREAEEKERERLKSQQAQAEREKQVDYWQTRKQQAQALHAIWGENAVSMQVNVWNRNGADRRVYLDAETAGRRPTTLLRAVYYVDGNDRNAPGTFTFEKLLPAPDGKTTEQVKEELKAVMKQIGRAWKSVKFITADALQYESAN